MIPGHPGLTFNDPVLSGIEDGHFWARNYPVYPPVSWSVSAAVCPSVALGVVGSLLTNSPGLTSQYTTEITTNLIRNGSLNTILKV